MAKNKTPAYDNRLSFTGINIHPQLKSNTCYCIVKVATRMRMQLDERLKSFEMIGPQFAMLKLLSIEGRMTQVQLGGYMAMDKATMVRMIDGLEQRQYVKRVQSETDRRAKWLELTPAGKKMISKLNQMRDEAEAELLAPLTATEKKQLKDIIAKLLV
jgi:DNA-binding MarR family transcriptional regulator